VIAIQDANGITNAFSYDAANRLSGITYGDGATVAYFYDQNGNRARMIDSQGTTNYVRDALDRLTSISGPNGIVTYGYDAVGNRAFVTYPDTRTARYAYDALNRLSKVNDWDAKVTSYVYDAASNLTKTTYPNGATASYSYDNANRLTNLTNAIGS